MAKNEKNLFINRESDDILVDLIFTENLWSKV